MIFNKIRIFLLAVICSGFCGIILAKSDDNDSNKSIQDLPPQVLMMEERPWSALIYAGSTDARELGQLIKGEYVGAGETLYSAELAYTLSQNNPITKFLSPLVSAIQVAGNYAYRVEHGGNPDVNEGDLYLMFRWAHFPWDNYLATTLAAGEGISYTSRIPPLEINGVSSDESERLLNFLVFEVTFALPSHPEWQLVGRIHHRSGAFGVFSNGNAGSNNVGLGIRYYFNI